MYGIWNDVQKRFVFGIRTNTAEGAYRELKKRIGKDYYKWRYSARPIPPGWLNPKNPNYRKKVKP